jgi:hypothetical protein
MTPLTTLAMALADDPSPPPALSPTDLAAEAELTDTMDRKTLRWLKPSPFHLPANPRGQTSFTAYTLEFGEVRLGVATIALGILPQTQIETSVPLAALSIPNATAKVHATRGGPFDIAALASYHGFDRPELGGRLASAGGMVSVQLARPWSVHAGATWTDLRARGAVDLASLASLYGASLPGEVGEEEIGASVQGRFMTVRAATDVRLNRRDSLVLQAEAMVWADVETSSDLPLPGLLGADGDMAHDGAIDVRDVGVATASWQFAWKHLELRVGAGVSAVPYAWLLQSTELCYRFGGATHARETRQRAAWRRNRRQAHREESSGA